MAAVLVASLLVGEPSMSLESHALAVVVEMELDAPARLIMNGFEHDLVSMIAPVIVSTDRHGSDRTRQWWWPPPSKPPPDHESVEQCPVSNVVLWPESWCAGASAQVGAL